MVAGEDVEAELAERTGELRDMAADQREAGAGEERAGFEVEAECGADRVMFADREGKGGAMPALMDQLVVVFVGAFGHVGEGEVGQRGEQAVELAAEPGFLRLELGEALLERCDLAHQLQSFKLVFGRLGGAYGFGSFVSTCL